ncbi:hypothetical protein HanRHA438_Chr09g0405651 [Helianthus annuus]|nr:hypothetical protein HanRHA438_Chr09g0405651 [Helianthus annuus]
METNEHTRSSMNRIYNTLILLKHFICWNFKLFKKYKTNELLNTNKHKRARYRMFTNTNEQTQPLFMFVYLTKQTKFHAHVRSFIKRTTQTNFSPNGS